jgi:hypothetical protein
MPSSPIHSLRPNEVFTALETGSDGLSIAEAQSRLSLYGANRLHVAKPVSLEYPRLPD